MNWTDMSDKERAKYLLKQEERTLKNYLMIFRTEIVNKIKVKITSQESFKKDILKQQLKVNQYREKLGLKRIDKVDSIDYLHYSKRLSFPPRKDDEPTLCGLKLDVKFSVTNNPFIVTCPKCIEELQKQKCSICGVVLKESEINNNDFYLACYKHKDIARNKTEKFFKENPDYTKW
jgi:hypothetical protein